MKRQSRGFSLLELSVILVILGLITLFAWRFLAARLLQTESAATSSLLERADFALTGFILSNHRLPCPDTDNDGLENCGGAAEVSALPYKTLGMADSAAGSIRYGVLRNAVVPSPAEVPEPTIPYAADPSPTYSRNADLALKQDRFYPLTLAIGTSFPALSVLETLNVAVSARDVSPPLLSNRTLGAQNGLDLCQALRIAEDPAPTDPTNHTHIAAMPSAPSARQAAYALALPGALDADGDGQLFDGAQVSSLGFDSPQRGQTQTNDDRVRAVSLGVLWSRLGCGEAISAVGHVQANAQLAAVMLYRGLYDDEQVLEQARDLANARERASYGDQISAGADIAFGIGSALHGGGDLAKIGNVPSVVAGALTVAAAAIRMPIAVHARTMALETQAMADARYKAIRQLRYAARPLAESISANLQAADAKGLYCGAGAATAACPP